MLDTIKEWLQVRELSYEYTEPDVIATAFSTQLENGEEQGFPLFILLIEDGYADSYIRFVIVPFIEQSYDGYAESLPLVISQINHDMPQIKFAFDGDGDLELIFDISIEQVNFNNLDSVLQTLANYAGMYYSTLLSVA